MKTVNKNLEELVKSGILDSLSKYKAHNDGGLLSDIYLYYNPDTRTITFFDDVEMELICITLPEKEISIQGDGAKELRLITKKVLKELQNEKAFQQDFIYTPFTVNWVNEDFMIVEELLFIDNDTIQLNNELWNNMDQELDKFFNDLMK